MAIQANQFVTGTNEEVLADDGQQAAAHAPSEHVRKEASEASNGV